MQADKGPDHSCQSDRVKLAKTGPNWAHAAQGQLLRSMGGYAAAGIGLCPNKSEIGRILALSWSRLRINHRLTVPKLKCSFRFFWFNMCELRVVYDG